MRSEFPSVFRPITEGKVSCMAIVRPRPSKGPPWVCCLTFLITCSLPPTSLSTFLPNSLPAPLSKSLLIFFFPFKNKIDHCPSQGLFLSLHSPYLGGFLTSVTALFLLKLSSTWSPIQLHYPSKYIQICPCCTPPALPPPKDSFFELPPNHSVFAPHKN